MRVTLVDHTPDPEAKVGYFASICYDSDKSREACVRRARQCKDKGHLATMRFAYATFHIEGISRICSHQIVRLAHAGILQRSQRYVGESETTFVQPLSLAGMPDDIRMRWRDLERASRDLYAKAIDAGMRKEDARFALLHSAETELYMCLNFQGWRDFLKNRTDKAAQWEVRQVALLIQAKLAGIAPGLFDSTTKPHSHKRE